jgi:hypothetical protein
LIRESLLSCRDDINRQFVFIRQASDHFYPVIPSESESATRNDDEERNPEGADCVDCRFRVFSRDNSSVVIPHKKFRAVMMAARFSSGGKKETRREEDY